MFKFRYLTFILSLFIFLGFACDEVAPVINGGGGGGGGEQAKKVVVEEFTGVRCVNCPAGSQALEALRAIHGENLIVVSIHTGPFAYVFPGDQDLATADGAAIQSLVQEPLGYPTAVVNRKHFDGEEGLQLGQSAWAGYIAQQVAQESELSLNATTDYDDADRSLDIAVNMEALTNIDAEDVRLTVYIVENGIVATQVTPSGDDPDYVHKHVFRDAITATSGDLITEDLTTGNTITKNFSYTLPAGWVAEKCHVVAFAHLGGSSLEVLQADEVAVTE